MKIFIPLFFSSTPFVNHHWLGGVIFYLVYALAGFVGLNLFFTAVSLMAFFLFFYVAKEEVGYKLAVPVAFFMTPLIAERVEIRPEILAIFLPLFFCSASGNLTEAGSNFGFFAFLCLW